MHRMSLTELYLLDDDGQPLRRLSEREADYIRAVTTQEERQAALDAAQSAEEQRYRESVEGRPERCRIGDPPAPEELGIRTKVPLLPAQASLVRLVGWIERERAELQRLREAKNRFLDAIGVPAVRQAEL